MALQDLTPQLRTRLSRLERVVGLFITVATLLMLFGLAYYIYQTAQRKGWFLTKAPYFTYLHSGAGLNVGDKVKLMGFDVGEITRITAEDPGTPYDVYIEFVIKDPYFGYVWDDSRVKVKSSGLLGTRYLEITKGGASGQSRKLFATYLEKDGKITELYLDKTGGYTNFYKGAIYELVADEPPELSAQLDQVVQAVKGGLPNLLALTNQLNRVLANAADATAQADELLLSARPAVSNLTFITEQLREPKGSLGEWLIPPSLNLQLTQTLATATTTLRSANTAVTNTDHRLEGLVRNLNLSLENLANITSNLHAQVEANTNLVTSVNQAIIHADDLVQGLKRHWLLRSAFKEKRTNQPPATVPPRPARPPKWEGR
jgi:ABC-type transporter Mla subunit MlaD